MKKCCSCGVLTDQFWRNASHKDGLDSRCKDCSKRDVRAHYARNPQQQHARRAKWARDNPDKQAAIEKKKGAKYRAHHAAKVNAIRRAWFKANPDKRAAWEATRKARKRGATPVWAEADQIKRVYAAARHLSDVLGKRMTVDHVVPLRHGLVCGLHVHANLQLLESEINMGKGNRTWPEMP